MTELNSFELFIVLLKVCDVIYPEAQIKKKKDQNAFEEFLIICPIKSSGPLKTPKENKEVSVRRRRSSHPIIFILVFHFLEFNIHQMNDGRPNFICHVVYFFFSLKAFRIETETLSGHRCSDTTSLNE